MIRNLSVSAFKEFAIIFFFCSFHVAFGCLVGWVLACITNCTGMLKRLMIVCIAFQDTTAIPLAYAIVLGNNSITNKSSDFKDKAMEYVLVYSVFIIIYKWTVAYRLMKPPETVSGSLLEKTVEKTKSRCRRFLSGIKATLNPPIYASLAAVPLALTPYVKEYVISGSGAVLTQNVFEALVIIGSTASPMIDLVLGVNLSNGFPKDSTISSLHLSVILLGKLFIMPLVGLGLTHLFYIQDLIVHAT